MSLHLYFRNSLIPMVQKHLISCIIAGTHYPARYRFPNYTYPNLHKIILESDKLGHPNYATYYTGEPGEATDCYY